MNALGARENELLSKKDAAGIASLFTSDGLLVMLAPQFAFKPRRDAIQKHYQPIIDAGASNITVGLKNLELRGNDGVWAAGNYSVTVKGKTIQGKWFRILKRENGTWKICYRGVRSRWCGSPSRRQFLTNTRQQQIEEQNGRPSLYVPFSGGKTSTFTIASFTSLASFGNRGKDSNRALQLGQCQKWRMTYHPRVPSYAVQ
jgi:ketosteroid isomerase-like protein